MKHPDLSSNVIGTVYSSKLFTYDKNANIFVSEISLVPEIFRQLFATEFETGFVLHSEKTKKYAFFCISKIQKNSSNEVEFWEFLPMENSIREFPQLNSCKVRVFNT